jgi:hypothetical protein
MSFDMTLDEVKSFDGGFYRPTFIKGPITLARFSDSTRDDAGRYGRFWLYGDYVRELMDARHSGLSIIKQISQQWAICDDWGDKSLLSLMDVPPGASVPAVWGRAKAQPKVFDPVKAKRDTSRSYEGGALQLIIPVADTNRQRNPWLASLILRKLTTQQLLTRPAMHLENPWVAAQRKKGWNI